MEAKKYKHIPKKFGAKPICVSNKTNIKKWLLTQQPCNRYDGIQTGAKGSHALAVNTVRCLYSRKC